MRTLLAILILFIVGCAGGLPPLDSGEWQMCTYAKADGTEITVPVPINIPVGYKHPDGTQLLCVSLPITPAPQPEVVE